jgi:hypothetical protein
MRWRSLLRFRLPTLLVVVAILCGVLAANRRGEVDVLGHMSFHDGPLAPGIWIVGRQYGWPYHWRSRALPTDYLPAEQAAFFEHDRFGALAANVLVAAALVATGAAVSEGTLWWLQRGKRRRRGRAILRRRQSRPSLAPSEKMS